VRGAIAWVPKKKRLRGYQKKRLRGYQKNNCVGTKEEWTQNQIISPTLHTVMSIIEVQRELEETKVELAETKKQLNTVMTFLQEAQTRCSNMTDQQINMFGKWSNTMEERDQKGGEKHLRPCLMESASAIKIQRAWRNGARLALVTLTVHDDNDPMIQSVMGYLAVVRARTEHGAETLAEKLSMDNVERGYGGEAPCNFGFLCWLDNLKDKYGWNQVFDVSGDTYGRGLSGGYTSQA